MKRRLTNEESKYWQAFRSASQYYCRENAIDKLDKDTSDKLRYDFHREFLKGAFKSHTAFDHDDYAVAIAWMNKYGEGGMLAAATLDLDQIRADWKRARYIWVIKKRVGLAYGEILVRKTAHIPEHEAVNWQTVPLDALFEASRMATQDRRSLDRRGR